MSGGVDSSVAAALVHEACPEAEGAYMKNWINEDGILGECPWMQDIEDARGVADQLKIPFRVVNLMQEYRDQVVKYLLEGYRSGITPNPDVMCNREIKFGAFLKYAADQGFDAVATGHYARRRVNANGTCDILEGVDKNKDQSYFLALLQQHQIARARFPVGDLPKPDVRRIAGALDLINATKKDSQGICFIGQVKMSDFLDTYMPDQPGPILSTDGKLMGEHRGLHHFTFGQRKGIRVASPVKDQAYVVVGKNFELNALIIGFDTPDTGGLYTRECEIRSLSFTNQPLPDTCSVLVRPRYRAPAVPATWQRIENDVARITFDEPQRAISPGQIAALYDGETMLGGAIFATK